MGIVLFGCGWQGRRHVASLKQLSVKLDCIIDVYPDDVHKSLPGYPNL